jgi:hypothetical protein
MSQPSSIIIHITQFLYSFFFNIYPHSPPYSFFLLLLSILLSQFPFA